jgi:PKD repeat protein
MFDPVRQQLWAMNGDKGTAITLPLSEVNGIAVDPISGDVYLLDSGSGQFLRVDATEIGKPDPSSALNLEPISTIGLGGEAGDLRSLAFDPATRHLFSINTKRQQLVEFTLTGDQVKVYDLSPFSLSEPLALAFAPSTDQTDAPSASSLYIAGDGSEGDVWEFTFDPQVAFSMAATTATLVQTIEVWRFSPPSPDASGVTYLPHSNRLLETDSEVNEKPIYQGVNQFEMTLNGSLTNTYDTTHFTWEPTGIAYDPDRNHLFITDDNAKMTYESDLSYNMVNSFPVSSLDGKGVDPEGVAYNSWDGRLYIAGGTSNTIFWIDPGDDKDFGTSDDTEGSFPATNLSDPEGITFNTDNGNLYGVGKKDVVAEYTTSGSVVQMIDISAANARKPAGLAYGPTSVGGGNSIYVTDRGVDADSGINDGKGDGKIYEFALGPVVPPAAPTASFTGSPTSGPIALTVNFTNSSSGLYDTCSWDFGDSNSSSECNNPSHIYSAIGTYSVSLTVSGPGGTGTKTEVGYIQVVEPAVAAFSGTPTEGTVPQTVTFTNSSSGVYSTCSWDFGDGGSSDRCDSPVNHEYTVGGVFTVSLTVNGTGGSSTETKSDYITVHQAPTAAFEGTPLSGPAPLSVNFSNLTTGNYVTCAWDFGDGETSSECGNPSHTYTVPGSYTVELSMSGLSGSVSTRKIDYISTEPNLMILPLLLHN